MIISCSFIYKSTPFKIFSPQVPIKDFAIPIQGLEEWFSEETAVSKREELRQLIVALQRQINPQLEYDPAQDGCMVGGPDEDEGGDLPNLTKQPSLSSQQENNASSTALNTTTAITNSNTAIPNNKTLVGNNVAVAAAPSPCKNTVTSTSGRSTPVAASPSLQSKAIMSLSTENLTAEQIVAAVTNRELKT